MNNFGRAIFYRINKYVSTSLINMSVQVAIKSVKENAVNKTRIYFQLLEPQSIKDELGNTLMHFARSKEMIQLLHQYSLDINVLNYYVEAPMHLAIENGDIEMLKAFLDCGVDVNSQNNYRKMTPLHLAIATKQAALVELLLEYHSDPEIKSTHNQDALYWAIYSNQTSTLKSMLHYMARKENVSSKSLLHYACQKNRLDVFKYLLINEPELSTIDETIGRTLFDLCWSMADIEWIYTLSMYGNVSELERKKIEDRIGTDEDYSDDIRLLYE